MTEADPQPDAQAPARSPFAEQLRVPQFGILHLLVWGAVTAALLKYYMATTDETSLQDSPALIWYTRITLSVSAILDGSIVVASGILIGARCCKVLGRLQPGHWLVLFSSLSCVMRLPLYPFINNDQTNSLDLGSTVLIGTVMASMYIWVIARWHGPKHWKILLGACALGDAASAVLAAGAIAVAVYSPDGPLSQHLLNWHYAFDGVIAVMLLLTLLAVVVIDVSRRAGHDWLHWLGTACLGLSCALTIAARVFLRYFL
jgi:hypothetical protein